MEKRKLKETWDLNSWKNFEILQQPNWPHISKYNQIVQKLYDYPSLIFKNQITQLKQRLIQVENNKAFLIQGGDCAESFKEFSEISIKNKLKILFQMATIISYGASIETVKIGRIAGQYAKPRTLQLETRDGITLPAYRGDSINDIAFDLKSRTPNPKRLLEAYNKSTATLNLIQPIIKNEFKNLKHFWNIEMLDHSKVYNRFEKIIKNINKSLKFFNAISNNINLFNEEKFNEFYISHECLLLDYESALTRRNNNQYYNASAHMVWLGDRTRTINSAHVEYLSGIENPIGIKCGPDLDIGDLKLIIKKINPQNERGKIVLICRLGVKKIKNQLPKIINMITKNQLNVIWSCDPMHGNTYKSQNNYKTRNFNTITKELQLFFDIHYNHKTNANGVHFELTPNDVTECVGGIRNIKESDLHIKYETSCDPRLNHEQSIELAFLITDLIKEKR
jgi:3-deoxy-7-phosphoheptulonate synthase